MRICANYTIKFYRYSKKENKAIEIKEAEEEYKNILTRYHTFYKRNLITADEMFATIEKKIKEINKLYKCYSKKEFVILTLKDI